MHADDRSAQVIVHEFQVGEVATAGDPSDPVFQVASKLAKDAVCETGWKNVNQRCLKSEFTPQANGEYELCCAKILRLNLLQHASSGLRNLLNYPIRRRQLIRH
jgi:hypothetical protein